MLRKVDKKRKRGLVLDRAIFEGKKAELKSESSSAKELPYDKFTSNMCDENSRCAMCAGDRDMGIEMVKGIPELKDFISNPVQVQRKRSTVHDPEVYFLNHSSDQTLNKSMRQEQELSDSTNSSNIVPNSVGTLDTEGGWASMYGLDMGRAKDYFLHLSCALFSPLTRLQNNNNWCNLKSEIFRSRLFKCSECGMRGATVGCFEESCRQIVHVPCAIKQGWKPALSCRKVKQYHCAVHREDIVSKEPPNIDISRGYENLPVTMDRCPCLSCAQNELQASSSSSSGSSCNTDTNTAVENYVSAGIYETESVLSPVATLASPHDVNFCYVTRNIDHEDVDSHSSSSNAISKCETCARDCGDVEDGSGMVTVCECSYKGIVTANSAIVGDEGTEDCTLVDPETLKHTRDGSLADYRVRFECGMMCSCSVSECKTRDLGRGLKWYFHVFVAQTPKIPLTCRDVQNGVCSRDSIPKGSFVCEITGIYRLSSSVSTRHAWEISKIISLKKWCSGDMFWSETPAGDVTASDSSPKSAFSFIRDDIYLDCREYGNVGRFIRHHKTSPTGIARPNLFRRLVYVDTANCFDFPRLALYASRDISPGEELIM